MCKLLWIILLLGIPISSFALKSDEKQPIQIIADHATVDQKQMISIFTGNIVITKGSLVVHADKGQASQDTLGDRILTLYGRPVTFEQLADDGQKIEGQGNQFDYNSKSGLAVLTGRARVNKGKNLVIGDKLTYNTKTQVYSANSDIGNGINKKPSGRVTIILDQMPNESTNNASKK